MWQQISIEFPFKMSYKNRSLPLLMEKWSIGKRLNPKIVRRHLYSKDKLLVLRDNILDCNLLPKNCATIEMLGYWWVSYHKMSIPRISLMPVILEISIGVISNWTPRTKPFKTFFRRTKIQVEFSNQLLHRILLEVQEDWFPTVIPQCCVDNGITKQFDIHFTLYHNG